MTRAIHGFGFALRRNKSAAEQLSLPKQIGIGVLVVALLISAFLVVYLKDLSRRMFIQYQTMQHVQESAELKRNKLLLEKGVWSRQSQIQLMAMNKLDMVIPTGKQIVIIRE